MPILISSVKLACWIVRGYKFIYNKRDDPFNERAGVLVRNVVCVMR